MSNTDSGETDQPIRRAMLSDFLLNKTDGHRGDDRSPLGKQPSKPRSPPHGNLNPTDTNRSSTAVGRLMHHRVPTSSDAPRPFGGSAAFPASSAIYSRKHENQRALCRHDESTRVATKKKKGGMAAPESQPRPTGSRRLQKKLKKKKPSSPPKTKDPAKKTNKKQKKPLADVYLPY